MTEIKANSNVKIHVLADETLGGIKREYVEGDRIWRKSLLKM